jgi:hypothetical protein
MNAKKQRHKDQRRANRLTQQAWEAAADGNFDLAVKMIRRAVELNPASPVLWHDQAALLLELKQDDKAAESFEAAIQLAPTFAESYAGLAALRARQGKLEQAVTLQREAVRHATASESYRDTLSAYEALLMGACSSFARCDAQMQRYAAEDSTEPLPSDAWAALAGRVESLSWPELDDRLTRHGFAHVPGLLDAQECEMLRTMFDEDGLFAKTVTMNKPRFGKGVYRYFAAPIPQRVETIRHQVYPHVARIANRWQHLLGEDDLYPATWPAFRSRCAAVGQTTPSPLLLRYEAGGFNAPHQDLRGATFFPLQLVVVLSPRADSPTRHSDEFSGGEFLVLRPTRTQTIGSPGNTGWAG